MAAIGGLSANLRCKGQGKVVISGYFYPNGASAIVQSTIKAVGVKSVTRSAAGVYQVQFLDNYADLLGFSVQQSHGTGQGSVFELDSTTANFAPTTGLVAIRALAAGGTTATDIGASTTNRVFFSFVLSTTGAGGNVG